MASAGPGRRHIGSWERAAARSCSLVPEWVRDRARTTLTRESKKKERKKKGKVYKEGQDAQEGRPLRDEER
jgi:hypothetical protein